MTVFRQFVIHLTGLSVHADIHKHVHLCSQSPVTLYCGANKICLCIKWIRSLGVTNYRLVARPAREGEPKSNNGKDFCCRELGAKLGKRGQNIIQSKSSGKCYFANILNHQSYIDIIFNKEHNFRNYFQQPSIYFYDRISVFILSCHYTKNSQRLINLN